MPPSEVVLPAIRDKQQDPPTHYCKTCGAELYRYDEGDLCPQCANSSASTELMQVVQLPIIEQHLRLIKAQVEKKAADAMALACTPQTLVDVRKVRSELSKEFAGYEIQRKEIKAQIMKPYEDFEDSYNECIRDLYRDLDQHLKQKIDDTEDGLKAECEAGLRGYFNELCEAEGVQWLSYDRAGIAVDMTSARQKVPKKLREKITQFVTRVSRGVALIADMDNAEEIMVEFKRTLDATEAISIVQERHRRVEAERDSLSEVRHSRNFPAQSIISPMPEVAPPKSDSFSSPEVLQAPEDSGAQEETLVYVSFKVTGTIQKIKELKKFLVDGGFEFEQLGD